MAPWIPTIFLEGIFSLSEAMIALIWMAAIIAALILFFRQVYSRFSRYGVNHPTTFPLLGNIGKTLLQREHFTVDYMKVYNSFPNDRFVGRYEFISPVLMVRDLELVKKIAIKDFEYFLDHRQFFNEINDTFFGRNLALLRGQEWKDMRSTLSPAFTSSKIRVMVPFMVEVGEQMIRSLKQKIKKSGVDYIDIDVKDLSSRYANDVIASCAFGLKVDSHMNEDNKFYAMGKKMSTFKMTQMIIIFLAVFFPYIYNKLNLSLFSKECKVFFSDLVLDTMKDRETRNIIRPDMIHLLMEAKKGKLTHDTKSSDDAGAGFATVEESAVGKSEINRDWTDQDLIAQALLFFVAGFETVSTCMSFLLHELAVNPDVQDKLYQEIKENDVNNDGKFDYNSIQQMPYLDMVVSEVLRLWPPATVLDRCCLKDYNLGKANQQASEDYIIRKGEAIHIPAWAFHRDAQYFPNPVKFDPERFSEENKHNIKTFSYMPFGLGPRNCIGSRFALCEVKVMAYQLVQSMIISPAVKTTIPAVLDSSSINIRIKGGHWVRLQSRDSILKP